MNHHGVGGEAGLRVDVGCGLEHGLAGVVARKRRVVGAEVEDPLDLGRRPCAVDVGVLGDLTETVGTDEQQLPHLGLQPVHVVQVHGRDERPRCDDVRVLGRHVEGRDEVATLRVTECRLVLSRARSPCGDLQVAHVRALHRALREQGADAQRKRVVQVRDPGHEGRRVLVADLRGLDALRSLVLDLGTCVTHVALDLLTESGEALGLHERLDSVLVVNGGDDLFGRLRDVHVTPDGLDGQGPVRVLLLLANLHRDLLGLLLGRLEIVAQIHALGFRQIGVLQLLPHLLAELDRRGELSLQLFQAGHRLAPFHLGASVTAPSLP